MEMEIIVLISIFLILSLVVLNLFLIFYIWKIKKRLNLFSRGEKKKNWEGFLLTISERLDKQEQEIKEVLSRISLLEKISKKTIQKVGVVRFNPFGDIGGNQSFVIALLDKENNGIVISSLYTREGNRVYTKEIKTGDSQHPLSKEEKEAIEKAINF